MFKIALKHWIYETCINVLFDKIGNNFCRVNRNIFNVGDKFTYIKTKFNLRSDHQEYIELEWDHLRVVRIEDMKGDDKYINFIQVGRYESNGSPYYYGIYLSDLVDFRRK